MDEKLRESLSALMDDEANELELERVLRQVGEDGEMRQTWMRYHAVRSAASGQAVSALAIDISQGVRSAIESETPPEEQASEPGAFQRLLRPLASFAVAASVAAVVVVGGQQLSEVGSGDPTQLQAGGGSPMVHTFNASPVRASYGSLGLPRLQPADRTAYRELARQRLQKYMQQHAEHAALNTPQGLIPYARVPEIRE